MVSATNDPDRELAVDALDEMTALAADGMIHALAGRRIDAAAAGRRLERLQDEVGRRALRDLLRRGASDAQKRRATAMLNDSVLLGAVGECAAGMAAPPAGAQAWSLEQAARGCAEALTGSRSLRTRRAAELDAAISLVRASSPDMLRLAAPLERFAEIARALGRRDRSALETAA